MINYAEVLRAISEIAPPILSLIILAAVIIVTMLLIVKFGIPALKATTDMFAAQTANSQEQIRLWKRLLDDTNAFNLRLLDDFRKELAVQEEERKKLEMRIDELEAVIKAKEEQITRLESEITELRAADQRKDNKIRELESELGKVIAERDALKARLEALEQVSKKTDGQKAKHHGK